VEREVAAVVDDPGDVLFLPFLYGSPHGAAASGSFWGYAAGTTAVTC
jgi:L-xylulokinase